MSRQPIELGGDKRVVKKGQGPGVSQRKNYIDFCLGTLKNSTTDPYADAVSLVEDCLRELSAGDFPPKLFVLWLTSAFKPYEPIVAAVSEELARRGFGD